MFTSRESLTRLGISFAPLLAVALLLIASATTAQGQAEGRVPSAPQDVMTFYADHDATVNSNQPSTNYGTANDLRLSWSQIDPPPIREGILLHFNLAGLPSNAVVDSAALELYLTSALGQATANVAVYRVTSSWSEGTVMWNTYLTVDPNFPWNFAIDSAVNAYKTVYITNYVNFWHGDPSQNHGVLIIASQNYGTFFTRAFESDEFNVHRPRLVINYHLPPPTPTPTPTQQPVLEGRVYEGNVGDESTPLSDVVVGLYCSNNAGQQGTRIADTATNPEGWYGLTISQVCEYYNIVETDPPGYTSVGATTVGGSVISANWIQYTYPLTGKTWTGNKFWDRRPTATPTRTPTSTRPTFTPTPTRTPTRPTNTPTRTPTPGRPTLTPTRTPTRTPPLFRPTFTPTLTPTVTPGQYTLTLCAVADAYISSQAPDFNNGSALSLFVSYSTGPDTLHNRTLARFALPSMPTGAVVKSAAFEAYLVRGGGFVALPGIGLYRVTGNWTESGVTWDNQPTINASPESTSAVNTVAGYKSWDVKNLAQGWVNGTVSNQGVELRGPVTSWGSREFDSREDQYCPRLILTIESTTPVISPTPTRTPTRTPTNTPPPPPVDRGVVITAIEVSQAVQDLSNSVPLVSGKKTVVRVHLKVTDGKGDLPGVSGYLHYPYGAGGGIFSPFNAGGTVTVRANPNRGVISDTLNFILPAAYATGSGFVLADINAPAGITFNGGQVELVDSRMVSFGNVPALTVRLYGVTFITGGVTYTPRNIDFANTESWLRRAYPISTLNSTRVNTTFPANQGLPNCGTVNAHLAAIRTTDLNSGAIVATTRYHGLVFDGPPLWYQMVGCCCNFGTSSGPAGQDLGVGGSNRWGWDDDGSYADWYSAHELGHGYGQCHPGFCDQTADTSPHCATYPYPNGTIGGPANDPNRYYGMDVETLRVYGPTWTDFMTYCNNQWISNFNYQRLRNRFINPPLMSMAPIAAEERLMVMGSVDLATDAVTLSPFHRMLNVTFAPEQVPGEYTIVLKNSGGGVLLEYPFMPKVQEVEQNGASCAAASPASPVVNVPAAIFELVPWRAGTARISIYHGDRELAHREVSPHAPSVRVVSPNGGEMV
ncbi:MAG: DNRLRE domain-containing protein, partial [Anaerolineae bacterium]|nr:DNRLRE domain-containing protein [Anaerolineae bacterium]